MIHPWYKDFTGTITEDEPGHYVVKGCYRVIGRKAIEITELPVGKWTDDYKSFLEGISEGVASKPLIEGYENNSTENKVKFTVYFNADVLEKLIKNKTLEKEMKLVSNLSTRNMHLFDSNNNIKKYNSPTDILKDYVKVRLEYYEKRKAHALKVMKNEFNVLNQKIRFIKMVCNDELVVFKRKKEAIAQDLKTHKFPMMNGDYDYLLGMKLYFLTEESILEYEKKQKDLHKTIEELTGKSAEDLWNEEI